VSITVDQRSTQAHNASSTSFGTNPSSGDKIVLAIWAFFSGGGPPTISSVTDNGTSPATWVVDVSITDALNNGVVWIYRADNVSLPSAGSLAITVNWTHMTLNEMGATALLGAASGAPQSTNSAEVSGVTSASLSAGTGAGAGSFYLGVHNDNGGTPETQTISGVFTTRFSQGTAGNIAGQAADFIGSGSQTFSPGWTGGSANSRDVIAVYSAAAVATAPRRRLLALNAVRRASYNPR